MQLAELLTVERVAQADEAGSKKRVLETLSKLIASGQQNLAPEEIFESLISRERLGSTGLGHGVAIPHGRVKSSEQTIGAFLQLQEGLDFDAIDDQPVDLMFALLVPEHSTEEHLQLLAKLAEMFSNPDLRERLRAADSSKALFNILNEWQSAPH